MAFFFHFIPGTVETLTRLPAGAPYLANPDDPKAQPIVGFFFLLFLVGATLQVGACAGWLARSTFDQAADRVERLGLVGTAGLDQDGAAYAGGEQHDGDDVARIRRAVPEGERDVAPEPRRELNHLRREPRMQAETVGYMDLPSLHGWILGHEGAALVSGQVAAETSAGFAKLKQTRHDPVTARR